jgi:putative transposase
MKAFKFRIYPTDEQKVMLAKHFGHCRWVYNHLLTMKKETWEKDKKSLSLTVIQHEIMKLKKQEETKWLKEVNSQSLQASAANLDIAYRRFFKKLGGYPQYKKKDNRQSFSVPQRFNILETEGFIKIPDFDKPIKTIFHRKVEGKVKNITISKTPSNKYYVSLCSEFEPKPLKKVKSKIGIDLGLTTFATLSTGEKIEPLKVLSKNLKRMRRLSKRLSKKVKGSKNRYKAKIRIAKLHEKISNTRKDYLHKISSRLIRENQSITLEDLNVAGMVQNRHLSRAIADCSWGEFVRQLKYKGVWYGRNVQQIKRFETSSKLCSSCGHKVKEMSLSVRSWTCPNCGIIHDRDINAAVNIKVIGMDNAKLKPVETVISVFSFRKKQVTSMKQEPLASQDAR